MNKTSGYTKNEDTLKQAFQALSNTTGARVKILGREIGEENTQIDARIKLHFRTAEQIFNVEAKGEVREGVLAQLLLQFGKKKDDWLFIARYIPVSVKEQLRANGINYLEATGNCYINTAQLYILIQDKPVKEVRKAPEGKLWKPAGLKLLFTLLQNRSLIGATYRQLAHTAGISLGSIQPILEALQKEGWPERDPDTGAWLMDYQERLINRWTEIYPVVLQAKLSRGTFRFITHKSHDWPHNLPTGTHWSGEPAGDLYTHQLIPEKFILYTDMPTQELIKVLHIIPDEKGNIRLYTKFWQDITLPIGIASVAPPLLVYADLRNSTDSRLWEIAERIKNKYLYV